MSNSVYQMLVPRKVSDLSATVLPDGRWLLYNAAAREAITLTAPAGILWELCDGRTTIADLIRQLQELYPDTPGDRLEQETLRTLNHFLEQELVTHSAT